MSGSFGNENAAHHAKRVVKNPGFENGTMMFVVPWSTKDGGSTLEMVAEYSLHVL